MERRRFPGVLELISGKFVRHSPAYYEWRIQDRTKRMRSPAENPELVDDLAVAFSKLGKHAEGIALLEQVLQSHPDRYESLSNLGTIHMLAGDLKTGKDYIDRAIVINPEAHFGREKYQSLLADYFLTARESPHPAAQSIFVVRPKGQYPGFAGFVLEKCRPDDQRLTEDKVKEELAAAQKGVLGMMHFANHDSPLLLEALGDLLIAWPTHEEDSLQLAARAYYRISQVSDDDLIQKQFKMAAKNVVHGCYDYIRFRGDWDKDKNGPKHDELEKLSADLERELMDAQAYVTTIADDEQRWIAEGVNVDEAFARKYYDSLDSTIEAANKQLSREWRDVRGNPHDDAVRRGLLIWAMLAVIIAGSVVAYRRHRAKRRALGREADRPE